MTDREREFWFAVYAAGGGQEYGPDTDCSRLVADTLARLHGERVEAHEVWADLMIRDDARPWSNIERIVAEGWGDWVDAPPPGRWCVFQGWRALTGGRVPRPSPKPNGHTGFFRELQVPLMGAGVVVEANTVKPWARRLTWGEVRGKYAAGCRVVALRGL